MVLHALKILHLDLSDWHLACRCLWRFTADNLQSVHDNPDWEGPCCRPPPALALQYPPQPQPRQRTSLQLGGPDRALRTGGSFSGRSVEVKRRTSLSGASSPRGRVSTSAEVRTCSTTIPLASVCASTSVLRSSVITVWYPMALPSFTASVLLCLCATLFLVEGFIPQVSRV